MTIAEIERMLHLQFECYPLHKCEHGDKDDCEICCFEYDAAQITTTAREGHA